MRTSFVTVLFAMTLARAGGAWPAYLSADVDGGPHLLRIDADGTVSDVTVEPRMARDLVVARDGSILAALNDGDVVSWDPDGRTARVVTSLVSRPSSVVETAEGEIYVSQQAGGVYRVAPDGSTAPVYEDPSSPPGRFRYEGLKWLDRGPWAGSLVFGRRSFLCDAYPQSLVRLPAPIGIAPPEIVALPFETFDFAQLDDGTLVATDWDCAGTEDLWNLGETASASDRVTIGGLVGTTRHLDVNEDGRLLRGAEGSGALAVDVVTPGTWGRGTLLALYADAYGAMTVDRRSPLQRLPCDRDGNHGNYVSCVAHATKRLVRDGRMTDAERSAAIVEAAQSDVGLR